MTSPDPVAAFIAAGGVVQRCPPAAVGASSQVTVSAEDRVRLRQHEAARERRRADRAAIRQAAERLMLHGGASEIDPSRPALLREAKLPNFPKPTLDATGSKSRRRSNSRLP